MSKCIYIYACMYTVHIVVDSLRMAKATGPSVRQFLEDVATAARPRLGEPLLIESLQRRLLACRLPSDPRYKMQGHLKPTVLETALRSCSKIYTISCVHIRDGNWAWPTIC